MAVLDWCVNHGRPFNLTLLGEETVPTW